jgi:hypothetical protein
MNYSRWMIGKAWQVNYVCRASAICQPDNEVISKSILMGLNFFFLWLGLCH